MVWEAKAGLRQIVFADRGNQTGEVQCCAVIGDSHRVGLKPLWLFEPFLARAELWLKRFKPHRCGPQQLLQKRFKSGPPWEEGNICIMFFLKDEAGCAVRILLTPQTSGWDDFSERIRVSLWATLLLGPLCFWSQTPWSVRLFAPACFCFPRTSSAALVYNPLDWRRWSRADKTRVHHRVDTYNCRPRIWVVSQVAPPLAHLGIYPHALPQE